jgi:signal transduction histidine kinase
MNKKNFVYLIIGFCITLLVMILFTVISFQRLNALIRYSDQVTHTYMVIEKIENLGNNAKDAETAVRGFVITNDSLYLQPLFTAKKEIPLILDTLKSLIADNDKQKARLALLRNTLELRFQILESSLPMASDKSQEKVIIEKMVKGRELMDVFRNELTLMKAEERKLLEGRYQNKMLYQRLAPKIFRQVSILVGFICILLFVLLLRELFFRVRFQHQLQDKVQELTQSNAELTQLAFAASHDLQEPIRKIRTFSERLLTKQKDRLDDEGKLILGRIDVSARRLHGMLEDISGYMSMINSTEVKQTIPLKKIVDEVIRSQQDSIQSLNASIEIGPLPELSVYPSQISSLTNALLDNSLKFAKPGVAPEIKIYCELLEGPGLEAAKLSVPGKSYFAISFSDNGIGFDNKFSDKIFQLFRKLHAHEKYSGKGIGLAICQRVMTNHNGFIRSDGRPGEGASFIVLFPRD